jgi:flagellar basal-body rod protein FlgB
MQRVVMIDALFADNNYIALKRMLDATELRHEALAANIANIETPGYKRIDLPKNFNEEFAACMAKGNAARLPAPTLVPDTDAPTQRLDGNNVEMDKELLAMSSNTVQYDTLTEFVSNSLKQLKTAITGQTQSS